MAPELPTPSPAIQVQGLVKRYDRRPVVDGVSFDVLPGEVFALLGPNGAGKTTIVEILEGYRRADGGSVRVLGLEPVRDGSRLKPRIGLMLQNGGLYPQISPREALRLFAAFYRHPLDPEELLDRLELRAVADSRFRSLSGGQKQRLSLGLALVGQPALVFLDEPTAAMDPHARRATWNIIRAQRDQGVTVLLTTHFMDEAEQLADRVAIIRSGRLVALDTPPGLRQTLHHEVRLVTSPALDAETIASIAGLPAERVRADPEGALVLLAEPTPALVARLASGLAARGVLLTELSAGARSLEHVFLALTGREQPDGR